ncbi:MAG TPA: bifunctional heptose 7-phosphate kinase/heptose 1-phosphate adenyltransferase [Fibrobacteria bacterium]|nr:bifunctional heptose 7-phosphate kinase/heptose 1-phosphate adenyltransferase [Fibrobacteria bacterium]
MDLRDALSAFTGARILVLGDSMVDEYVTGDCSRLSPEAPVPILRVDPDKTRRVLGGAANTAANIASLGGTPVLFALFDPADSAGAAFTSLCAAQNIDVRPFSDGRPTMVKMRVVDQRQQLLRLDREDTREIAPGTEADILAAFRAALPDAAAVVLSDYAKGFFSAALTRGIIDAAHAAGKPVVIDPRPRHVARYHGADYVTPNWKESLGMLGWEERDATPEAVKAVGCALRERLGAHILLTLGPAGIALFGRDGRESILQPVATPREVFDVSGAGDTVVAAFTLALATGQPPALAVEIANRAAGVVVGKLGTATVTREEISAVALESARRVTRDQLAPLSALLRAQGKRIVTINGSFDLLHAGHLHILEEARRQGDVLVVGVNSDASVRRYKAADRPFVGEDDRARLLLALRVVDYVHVFDEDAPMAFLEKVRPHVHVNGSEYGAECIEAPVVKQHGGRIHIVEKIPGLSTSALVDHIRGTP